MPVKKQYLELDIEQQTGFKLGKEYVKAVYCYPAYLFAEFIMQNARLDEAQAGIKISGRNINNIRYTDDTTLMAESEEFTQTHVHRVSDAIQPSHPLSSPSPPAPNPSQHQSLFQ